MAGLQRKNTVFFKIEEGEANRRENYVEVARAVNQAFGANNIECLQPIGKNTYNLTFKHPHLVGIAKERNLLFRNKVVKIETVEDDCTTIWLADAPFELSDIPLKTVLSQYGEVKRMSYVKIKEELGGYYNGDRRVEMIMKEAVPNFLRVGRYIITTRYAGLQKVCRKCGMPGHFSANCSNNEKCSNCGRPGHKNTNCLRCKFCKLMGQHDENCPSTPQFQQGDWSTAEEENANTLLEDRDNVEKSQSSQFNLQNTEEIRNTEERGNVTQIQEGEDLTQNIETSAETENQEVMANIQPGPKVSDPVTSPVLKRSFAETLKAISPKANQVSNFFPESSEDEDNNRTPDHTVNKNPFSKASKLMRTPPSFLKLSKNNEEDKQRKISRNQPRARISELNKRKEPTGEKPVTPGSDGGPIREKRMKKMSL